MKLLRTNYHSISICENVIIATASVRRTFARQQCVLNNLVIRLIKIECCQACETSLRFRHQLRHPESTRVAATKDTTYCYYSPQQPLMFTVAAKHTKQHITANTPDTRKRQRVCPNLLRWIRPFYPWFIEGCNFHLSEFFPEIHVFKQLKGVCTKYPGSNLSQFNSFTETVLHY